jgi:hypothetical protein
MTININAPLLFGIILFIYWFVIIPPLERKLEIGVLPYYICGIISLLIYAFYMLYRLIIWLPSCPVHINFT